MDYPNKRSDIPAGPGGGETAAAERAPEIARYLDQQCKILEMLHEAMTRTESMLGPILRGEAPTEGKEEKLNRPAPVTHIGGILDQHNKALNGMINRHMALQKRIEV